MRRSIGAKALSVVALGYGVLSQTLVPLAPTSPDPGQAATNIQTQVVSNTASLAAATLVGTQAGTAFLNSYNNNAATAPANTATQGAATGAGGVQGSTISIYTTTFTSGGQVITATLAEVQQPDSTTSSSQGGGSGLGGATTTNPDAPFAGVGGSIAQLSGGGSSTGNQPNYLRSGATQLAAPGLFFAFLFSSAVVFL